jgi:hypothetical protein
MRNFAKGYVEISCGRLSDMNNACAVDTVARKDGVKHIRSKAYRGVSVVIL